MDEKTDQIIERTRRRVTVRSVSVLVMGVFALGAFLLGVIRQNHIIGVALSIAAALFPLGPTYFILTRRPLDQLDRILHMTSHVIQIVAYTSLIYFLGGIEATYLLPIYAAVIVYEGILSHRAFAYFTASLCSFFYGAMVLIEHLGILPHQNVVAGFAIPPVNQLIIVLVVTGLLFVIAILTANTAILLKKQNQDLELAVEQVREADRTKSQFLANMSHELRTPLNHIIGFTDLILGKHFGPLNESQVEYLADIHGASEHLLSLINDLLDLSKVEAGKLELELGDVRLHDVIRNSLNMVSVKALNHGINMSFDVSKAPEMIRADNRKLKQIMYNLLSNAVKFTPDGGNINVVASSAVNVGNSDENVQISVIDAGIGIRENEKHNLFEPFDQLANSSNQNVVGTGLGLALTKRLVELHGGTLTAMSEGEGKGSTFTFTLPILGKDEAPPKASEQTSI